MITLIRRNYFLAEAFGHGVPPNGTAFKLSLFNFVVDVADGQIVVYNTLSNSMILMDADEWRGLRYSTGEFVVTLSERDRNLLELCGIVLPESVDEMELYKERFEFIQAIAGLRKGVVRYNIYTTTHCNARCFYCFEEGIHREHMSLATADKVANYVSRTYSRDSDEIYFRWFGGEPLVNPRVITRICERAKECGIRYYSSTSTNGLLLDAQMLKLGQEVWNLKKVRFSFDGVGSVHNSRKNFSGCNGDPYEITMLNLDRAINSGIRVVVRLTIDLANAESIGQLSDLLIGRYAGSHNLTLYSKCIFSEVSKSKYQRFPEAVKELLKINANLTEKLLMSGLYDCERLAPAGLRTYYCAANDPHKVVISPNGALCSCECNCVRTEFWGDVESGITDQERYGKWHSPPAIDGSKCSKCPMLPVCTPYVTTCPSDYFSCEDRFFTTMRLFVRENYRRFIANEALLPDSDTFDKYMIS